ncbi:MAG: Wzz/FepE/Etk N-terminal domain-containing protein [Deltaproteobacteria bacterium]|nr:Wzz/FepE/Etk N-terminal domain-containing protein [Deltaproteobacteria bacterium]
MTEESQGTANRACEEEPNEEINLLDYWRVIWKRRRMIAGLAIVTAIAALVISLFMTDIYRAKAVIMPVAAKDSGGSGAGLAALAQQFGGIPGISLPGSASSSEIVSLLKSNILREKMIQEYNLMPVLFHKRWDPGRQAWKKSGELGFFERSPLEYLSRIKRAFAPKPPAGVPQRDHDIPTTWDALRLLDETIRISQDVKQNTITISADFYNPELAARIVDHYLATLTNYMSNEAKRVARTNRQYLEEQLGSTADPIIKQKTYNMIAQQI